MRALKIATLFLVLLVNAFALLWLIAPRITPAAGVPVSQTNGDIDGDGSRNITDAVRLLQFLFQDGPPPVPVACAEAGPGEMAAILEKLEAVREAVENPCRDRIDRMIVHGDGTLTDRCTGLMWRDQSFPDADAGDLRDGLTWEEALELAEAHEAAGFSDWRVPTVQEIRTLVDWKQRQNVPGGPEFWRGVLDQRYWTADPLAVPGADSAWSLAPHAAPRGYLISLESTLREYRICLVRGSIEP